MPASRGPRLRITGGDKVDRLMRDLRRTRGVAVKAGFLPGSQVGEVPAAAVATWLEFGTRSIPARPALRGALDELQRVMIAVARRHFDARHPRSLDQLARILGPEAVAVLRRAYLQNNEKPIAAATAEIRARFGTGQRPLVRSGELQRALDHRVVRVDGTDDDQVQGEQREPEHE